jgi:hypothetical protein
MQAIESSFFEKLMTYSGLVKGYMWFKKAKMIMMSSLIDFKLIMLNNSKLIMHIDIKN